MERQVELERATTPAEIRKAVAKVWKEITPEFCVRISKRIRRHMLKVIEQKGGNFFDE